MGNVLSYCLYDCIGGDVVRGHDIVDAKPFRYWFNIPFISIINKYYFKNFITRIYCPKEILNHPLYYFIDKLQNSLPYFEVEIIDKPYIGTQPSIWRVKALWDDNCEFCFCKDIDSVLNPKEAQCMRYFMLHDSYLIQNIRGVWQHNFKGSIIMAGLCGFRPKRLKKELPLTRSFNDFLKFCDNNKIDTAWGYDQLNLIDFFVTSRSPEFLTKFLDIYVQPDFNKISPAFKQQVKASSFYNIISLGENYINGMRIDAPKDILSITKDLTSWLGEPVDTRGNSLNNLLSLNYEECKIVKNIIYNDNHLKDIYRI